MQLDLPAVQEEPLQTFRTALRRSGAVERVARHRVTYGGQVHPDLVSSAGDQVQLEQRPAGEALADPISGHCRPPGRDNGHPRPMTGISSNRRLDAPGVGNDGALNQSQIRLLDVAVLELGHQAGLGLVVLGHHQQAARVAVKTMDDTRTLHAGDAAVLGAACQQGIDERATGMTRRRMNDQTRGLVDDQQVLVFVDH